MKGKKYILLKAKKIPVWLKYWAGKGGVTPVLKNLYLGYSRQQSTTGANLQKYTVRSVNNVGIDYSCNAKGQVIMQGTATRNLGFAYNQVSDVMTLNAGTYKLKVIGNYEGLIFNRTDISRAISLDDNNEGIVVIDNDNTEFRILVYVSTNVTYNADFYITLTPGDTATEERYTGGIPAPNPNYPFEIENLTGNVPIQAGNKVINFPLSNGQKLYKDCILSENGIQYKRTDITLYNRSWAVYNVTDNLGNTYGFSNALSKEPRQSQVLVDFALSNILTQQKRSVVSSIDNEGFYLGNGNRLYIKIRQDLLPNGTTNELTQLLTNKNASLEYELAETETIPYTKAQQKAYINLCKHFEENTDLNEFIIEGG